MQPTDPLYADQWHFAALGDIETVWDEYSGAGIHVGVYDSGVELEHPDLAGNYDPSLRVIIDGSPLPGEPNTTTPDPHGTAVAGLIAAGANNGLGGVGVAWGVHFASVDITDPSSPTFDDPDSTEAFEQIATFDVVNHSWNALVANYDSIYSLAGSGPYANANSQYANASENGRGGLGTVIVQGIGNSNVDSQHSGLNATRFTISVGGTQEDGFAADFSNYGACVLVTAPATNIVTTDITGSAGYVSDDYVDAVDNAAFPPTGLHGTSFATPIVSGVAALMLDANAGLGWRDVQNILAASAKHTGSDSGDLGVDTPHANENGEWSFNDAANWNGGGMHFSNDYGYGAVDAYAAVRMAEVWSLFTTAQTTANEKGWENTVSTGWSIAANDTATADVLLTPTPDNIDVEHVDVQVSLTHSDFTKLRIFLVAPSGTEVELFDGSGGTDAIADSGLTWVYGVDALRGEDANGTWTVRVENTSGTDTGTLNSVKVTAYGQGGSTDDIYHYTDEFLAMAALSGEASRTTLTDGGGIDWIDAAAVTGAFALNLTAGALSKVNGLDWFTIAAGTLIENAITGDGNDTLIGNAAANRLYGMRGNDTLDGATGADEMHGGKGNDTYVVDNAGDVVNETGGAGLDLVRSAVTFSLANPARAIGAIENLLLLGGVPINGTGNALANSLLGNLGINVLNGAGNDVLTGGRGRDMLIGGTGLDRFDFNAVNESVKGPNRDTISGFSHAQHDRIDLSTIDADQRAGHAGNQAFKFIGADTFAHYHALHPTVFGMVRFAGGVVQGNVNAGMAADFEIKLAGAASLVGADFLL